MINGDVLREVGRATVAATQVQLVIASLHVTLLGGEVQRTLSLPPARARQEIALTARVHRSPDVATEVILWVNAATTVLAQRQAFLEGGPAVVFNPTNAHFESVAWTPRCGSYKAHDVTELRHLADRLTSTAEDGFTVLDHAQHTPPAGAHP